MNQDINVQCYIRLPSPKEIQDSVQCSAEIIQHIHDSRQTIMNIIDGLDRRMLLIIGPCSIHDTEAAVDYARRLKGYADLYQGQLFIVMRTYFEKPRTITGWKGLLYDPDMDGTDDIARGIITVRKLLIDINAIGLPCACEFLDPNMPQYYADLISWGAIGARTTESQVHRQLASGLSCPIGFKNSTSGSITFPLNSIKSCSQPHSFPGIDMDGQACIIRTLGNKYCQLVLRGSDQGPNYHMIRDIAQEMPISGRRIVIDCSHGNSGKCHAKQIKVWLDVIEHYLREPALAGIMVESNILSGSCSISDSRLKENYGRSVTDKCIGWDDTRTLIRMSADHMADRLADHMADRLAEL